MGFGSILAHLRPTSDPCATILVILFEMQDPQQCTTLHKAQAESLFAALSRRLALIRGPRDAGKSYTGVALVTALLANCEAVNLGPIFCVCYTNHALDQLLEHLVAHSVYHIIRVWKPLEIRGTSLGPYTSLRCQEWRSDMNREIRVLQIKNASGQITQ